MPADPSTWGVFGHHQLLERSRRLSADCCRDLGDWAKVVGDRRVRARSLAGENVLMPEGEDPTIRKEALELERLQREFLEGPDQSSLISVR